MQNLGQILKSLTPVKIRGGMGKTSESKRSSMIIAQGGSIRFAISS